MAKEGGVGYEKVIGHMSIYISFLAVVALCVICITLPYWRMFKQQPHPPILSVSAGVGLTYVFLALLPKLAEVQASFQSGDTQEPLLAIGLQAYLAALAGFVIFLLIANQGFFEDANTPVQSTSLGEMVVFLVFAIYYIQIGFLLGEWPIVNWFAYLALTFAFGMHLVGINYHLLKRFPRRYPNFLRWLFGVCLLAGWGASVFAEQLSTLVKLSTMFVAGGIIITAIREEIPSQKDANIPYFLASVLATTLFVVATEALLLS